MAFAHRQIVKVGICLIALAGVALLWVPLNAGKKPPVGPTALPDLSVDVERIGTSLYFDQKTFASTDCAVVEGCVGGTGLRKLMRFDVAIRNTGHADLVLGDPRKATSGFEVSPCHGHYHFTGFVEYKLYKYKGLDLPLGPQVGAGRKQAFCLEDYEKVPGFIGAGKGRFTCSNQGITVGWQDVYRSYLDCQWLDVTDVTPGQYWLTVTVDALNKIAEEVEGNNTAVVLVTVPAPAPGL